MRPLTLIKLGWSGLLLLLFVSFSLWYGGNGKPITPEEGAQLIQKLEDMHGDADSSGRDFITNIKEMIPRDDGKEFYAVNLEQLKPGEAARAADAAYGKIVFPQLIKRGGHPVFLSMRAGLMLGDYGRAVDRVAVVRYRSLRDMIDMASDPSMEAGEVYKFAALDHTEVFITRPTITFVHVRLIIGLILILLWIAGLQLINLLGRRKSRA